MAGRKKATRKPTARKTAATQPAATGSLALTKAYRLLWRAVDLLKQSGENVRLVVCAGKQRVILEPEKEPVPPQEVEALRAPVKIPGWVMGPNGKTH